MNDKIVLSDSDLSGLELKYVKQAFDKNEISVYGKNLSNFEKDLESYLNQNTHVACLSSGTAAVHLSLILAGVSNGDEVLCQTMTFSASVNPIVYQGAIPIFIDSEEDTWNMSPIFLEKAIKERISKNKKPKAIMMVHLYGMPSKVDEITAIAKKYEITLIEDAAEALGSAYKNRKCGTFGDFSILSFNGNKIITTSGGGALICKNEIEKSKAIFLATQARDEAPHYQHSEIGYNYRMNNIAAGIGRGQMEVLDKHVPKRRAMNLFYASLFNNREEITLLQEPNEDFYSNHWLSCIIVDDKKLDFNREDIRKALLKNNIEARPLWKPMHLQPVFKTSLFYGQKTSEFLFNKGLCLPSGSNITEDEKRRIQAAFKPFIS